MRRATALLASGSALPARFVDRATRPARARGALSTFFVGSVAWSDDVQSRAAFALNRRLWRKMADDANHVAAFREGLEHVPEPRVAVDLGCGAGGSTALLARRWPAARVIGVDRDRRLLREAAAVTAGTGVELFRSDLRQPVPWLRGQVDLVTCLNYLPHPPDAVALMRAGAYLLVVSTFQTIDADGLLATVCRGAGLELVTAADSPVRGSFTMLRLRDTADGS